MIGRLVPALLVCLVLPGCEAGKRLMSKQMRVLDQPPIELPEAFRDPVIENGQVQRILALPLLDETPQGDGSYVVSQALRDEMLKLRMFDVVNASAGDAATQPGRGPKNTGRIDVGTIIDLGRRYGVDAVLFGAIDHYRPYEPPSLGMSLSLVDVETGRIVWHVRDFVDGSDERTSVAMRYFFEDENSIDGTVFGPELISTAPQWFARFAARRVAETLLPPELREDAPAPVGTGPAQG